jgi:hypothetical protein
MSRLVLHDCESVAGASYGTHQCVLPQIVRKQRRTLHKAIPASAQQSAVRTAGAGAEAPGTCTVMLAKDTSTCFNIPVFAL